jgi:hypothetical protein
MSGGASRYAPGVDIRDRLLDATIALSSERSLAGVLQRVVETAAELTDATYGALGFTMAGFAAPSSLELE